MPSPAQTAALFGAGALVGAGADQIHVHAGVLAYPGRANLLGQPVWVPLLFGCAGVVLALANAALLHLTRERRLGSSVGAVAGSLAWFLAAYVATALFQHTPRLLAGALLLAWGARVARAPTRDKLLAGLLFAVGGTLFEAALSSTGVFSYLHPDLGRVPIWLPALYLHASLMTREACLVVLERRPGHATARRAGDPA